MRLLRGLDRKLRTPQGVRALRRPRRQGEAQARPAPDGQRVLRGPLALATDGTVAVVADGKRVDVPLADVAEANLVFELTPAPKRPAKKLKANKA